MAVIIDGYAPDLSEMETVPVKILSADGEVILEENVAVRDDILPDETAYCIGIFEGGSEEPSIVFISKYVYDPIAANMYPSNTQSTLLTISESYIGKTFRIELPYTDIEITPIPEKYLTESPVGTFDSKERVVGTWFGDTLYEKSFVLTETSATENDTPLNITGGYIKQGYIVDSVIMLYTGDAFVKSYTQYNDGDNYFYCVLNLDKITSYRSLPERYDDYNYTAYAKIRYTKKEVTPTESTVKLPDGVEYQTEGASGSKAMAFGNYDKTLNLTIGNSYTVTMSVMGQTETATVTCSEWSSSGNSYAYLDCGASLGYFKIFANAHWDYDNLDAGGDPTMVQSDGYCFRCDAEMVSTYTITVDVTENS